MKEDRNEIDCPHKEWKEHTTEIGWPREEMKKHRQALD